MLSKLEAIKSLLLREWDPIGISAVGGPKDEYDAYATRVFGMLEEGADAVAVAGYLNWVVTSRMSLRGNLEWDRAIAAKAVAIHNLGTTRAEMLCELNDVWEFRDGRMRAGGDAESIDDLLKNKLIEVRRENWAVLYRDKETGEFWDLTYPEGEMHGGGPRRLRVVSNPNDWTSYQKEPHPKSKQTGSD